MWIMSIFFLVPSFLNCKVKWNMFYVLMNIECVDVCKDSVNSMIDSEYSKDICFKKGSKSEHKKNKHTYSKKLPEKWNNFITVSDSILVNLHSKGNVTINGEIQIFFHKFQTRKSTLNQFQNMFVHENVTHSSTPTSWKSCPLLPVFPKPCPFHPVFSHNTDTSPF